MLDTHTTLSLAVLVIAAMGFGFSLGRAMSPQQPPAGAPQIPHEVLHKLLEQLDECAGQIGNMQEDIEELFGLRAHNCYGLSEMNGPGVAFECPEQDGLHLWEDHFYPEVIDPATGRVLPDGERGELVFTTLTKEGMPVIRYRTRDLTRLLPGTARSMRRMEKITGRSDDMMIVRGVNVFPTQIEEQILKVKGLAPHYQLVLTREGRLDEMEVLVEASPASAQADARQRSATELGHLIKNLIGVTAKIAEYKIDRGLFREA